MKTPISIRRGTVAAVFIDLQEEHRKDKRYLVEGFADILANVQRLQEAARRNFVPLYHWAYIVDLAEARPFHPLDESGKSAFSDKDDPLTAICREVAPRSDEATLVKHFGLIIEMLFELTLQLVVFGVPRDAHFLLGRFAFIHKFGHF